MALFQSRESDLEDLRQKVEKAETQLDFLIASLRYHVKDFYRKRNQNRNWTVVLKMYSILVAATITVILGFASSPLFTGNDTWLDGKGPTYFALGALVLSTTVTVVSSWEAFSGYDWKWIRYRSTLADLYQLKDDLQMRKLAGEVPTDELNAFYGRLKGLLEEVNEEWANRRALPENQPKEKPANLTEPAGGTSA